MGLGPRLFRRKKKTISKENGEGSRVVNSQISSMQVEEVAEVFKKFDANGDGKISWAELGAIMGALGHSATEEELKTMIREVDKDGDEFIDLQEFVELNMTGVDIEEALGSLRDAFAVYDIDGNGSISAEELQKVMTSLGDECSIEECRKMIGGADCNGDGSICFEEFKMMMMDGARSNVRDHDNGRRNYTQQQLK